MKFFLVYLTSFIFSCLLFWEDYTRISWSPKLNFPSMVHLCLALLSLFFTYVFLFFPNRILILHCILFFLLGINLVFSDLNWIKNQNPVLFFSSSFLYSFCLFCSIACLLAANGLIDSAFFSLPKEDFPWLMSNIILFASCVVAYGLFSFSLLFWNEKKFVAFPVNFIHSDSKNLVQVNNLFPIPCEIKFRDKKIDFMQFEIILNFKKVSTVHLKDPISQIGFSEENLCLLSAPFCHFIQKEIIYVRSHN